MGKFTYKALIPLTLLLASSQIQTATAADCQVRRTDILSELAKGVDPEKLAEKYAGCIAADGGLEPNPLPQNNAIGQSIKNTGSTRYEALTSCGYHPQRKEFTCPIEIRQPVGFGGVPALQPAGSYEYVLFCVNNGGGYQPVNINGVHVHDEAFGSAPNWYHTAVVPANYALFNQPLIGQTMRARAILSWGIPPAGCNFVPIWGNQADFRIRLDP